MKSGNESGASGKEAGVFGELTTEAALSKLKSTPEGLSGKEAQRRLGAYGPNTLVEEQVSLWRRLFSHFWGPIRWMNEIAAVARCDADGLKRPAGMEDFSITCKLPRRERIDHTFSNA